MGPLSNPWKDGKGWMKESLSSKCVTVVCGNTIQDGWLATSDEKYSLRVFSPCTGGSIGNNLFGSSMTWEELAWLLSIFDSLLTKRFVESRSQTLVN